jgi:hypothetical protein
LNGYINEHDPQHQKRIYGQHQQQDEVYNVFVCWYQVCNLHETKNMRHILPAVIMVAVLFSSCKPKSKTTDEKAGPAEIAAAVANYTKLLGSYVGSFGNNKITLLITKAVNDTVEGRSIVGGNDRPFRGLIKFENGKYAITAKEPGDEKNDGIFEMVFDEQNVNAINGNWKPVNTGTATVDPKSFSLQRRVFVYLKDVGDYPQASKRLLTDDDVSNLMKDELENMRNEIFARHGYCFKKKILRDQFENADWYIPNTVDVKADLTEIEKKNIAKIKHYEKYAEDYGDDFGR